MVENEIYEVIERNVQNQGSGYLEFSNELFEVIEGHLRKQRREALEVTNELDKVLETTFGHDHRLYADGRALLADMEGFMSRYPENQILEPHVRTLWNAVLREQARQSALFAQAMANIDCFVPRAGQARQRKKAVQSNSLEGWNLIIDQLIDCNRGMHKMCEAMVGSYDVGRLLRGASRYHMKGLRDANEALWHGFQFDTWSNIFVSSEPVLIIEGERFWRFVSLMIEYAEHHQGICAIFSGLRTSLDSKQGSLEPFVHSYLDFIDNKLPTIPMQVIAAFFGKLESISAIAWSEHRLKLGARFREVVARKDTFKMSDKRREIAAAVMEILELEPTIGPEKLPGKVEENILKMHTTIGGEGKGIARRQENRGAPCGPFSEQVEFNDETCLYEFDLEAELLAQLEAEQKLAVAHAVLTPKQIKVFDYMQLELAASEIAVELGMKPNTVDVHISDIRAKLAVAWENGSTVRIRERKKRKE